MLTNKAAISLTSISHTQEMLDSKSQFIEKKKLNIVHLGMGVFPIPPGDKAAGVEEYIFQLTRYLAHLDCRVHVIDIRADQLSKNLRELSSSTFHEIWKSPLPCSYKYSFLQHLITYLLITTQVLLFAVLSAFKLYRLMGKEKIDIVHAHNRDTTISAAIVNKLRGKPSKIIYTPQSPLGLSKLRLHKKIINFAEIPAFKLADHIIALTPAVKEWLVSEFKINPHKITSIHVGIARDEIEAFLSHKTGDLPKSKIILCTGAVSARKNQLTAVKTALEVSKNHLDVKFIFTGPINEAQYYRSIQKFIADNKLSEFVEFRGLVPKEELYNLYSNAILFFFPSTAEVQPTSLMEALAFSLPIISSNIASIADVFNKNPESAILTEPYDINAMATAINYFIENDEARQIMSKQAKGLSYNFSYESIAKQTLNLYDSLYKIQ